MPCHARRSFDFDGDERWQQYKMNLEIPLGRESALQKFKAKWYKREIVSSFRTKPHTAFWRLLCVLGLSWPWYRRCLK